METFSNHSLPSQTEALEKTREFHDTYPIRVDKKGRIATPPTYKETFGDGIIISAGLGNSCLVTMSLMGWRKTVEDLVEATLRECLMSRNQIKRLLFSRAYDDTLDSQGRLTLKPSHRTYAGLSINSQGVIVGAGSRLEVWSSTEWIKHTNKINAAVREVRI